MVKSSEPLEPSMLSDMLVSMLLELPELPEAETDELMESSEKDSLEADVESLALCSEPVNPSKESSNELGISGATPIEPDADIFIGSRMLVEFSSADAATNATASTKGFRNFMSWM
ncbi:unnamed protein product [Hyaloperonospora brassicae]|nr:unnamed protein product [Hyaloperonospora brassicae]